MLKGSAQAPSCGSELLTIVFESATLSIPISNRLGAEAIAKRVD
jgi:hypothetical protein